MEHKTMTPEQKLKQLILARAADSLGVPRPVVDADTVDEVWYDLECDAGPRYSAIDQAASDLRSSGIPTGLRAEYSRHYESEAVAAQMLDGSWVGWTYWYGGGKHAYPAAIPWMEEAYELACQEEEKLVIVRTFSRVN